MLLGAKKRRTNSKWLKNKNLLQRRRGHIETDFNFMFLCMVLAVFTWLCGRNLSSATQSVTYSRAYLKVGKKEIQAWFILLCFPLLHFTDTAFFYKLNVCGHPVSHKSVGLIFLIACAVLGSLCHIQVTGNILNVLLLLCFYGDLLSLIFDVTIVIILGYHKAYPHNDKLNQLHL